MEIGIFCRRRQDERLPSIEAEHGIVQHGFAVGDAQTHAKIFVSIEYALDVDAKQISIEQGGDFLGKSAFTRPNGARDITKRQRFRHRSQRPYLLDSRIPLAVLTIAQHRIARQIRSRSILGKRRYRRIDHLDPAQICLHSRWQYERLAIGRQIPQSLANFD